MKEIIENFLFQGIERNGVAWVGSDFFIFSILEDFLKQRGLVKVRLMNTVQDSVKADE
jgi:hypothetical protein